jgi:hypothetical protein
MSPENSRIDDKIRRDALLKNELENLWDSLDARISEAAKKLTDHYNAGLSSKLNDHNSAIRVTAKTVEIGGGDAATPELQIRIERQFHRVIVTRTDISQHPKTYPIKADLSSDSLRFADKDRLLTPLMFAESLLSEFTKIDLDS